MSGTSRNAAKYREAESLLDLRPFGREELAQSTKSRWCSPVRSTLPVGDPDCCLSDAAIGGYEEHDGTSWSAREPIAGPLTGGTDARFSYYDTLGVARTPNTPTVRTSIARVDVRLQASGQSDVLRLRGGEPLQDSLNFRIGIRNFR